MIVKGLLVCMLISAVVSHPLLKPISELPQAGSDILNAISLVSNKENHSPLLRRRRGVDNARLDLITAFIYTDSDNSSQLSYREFIQLPGINDSEKMRNLFRVLDFNRDGELNIKEYVEGLLQLSGSSGTDRRSKLRGMFNVVDTNKDSLLSHAEYANIVNYGERDQLSQRDIAFIISKIDTNGDYHINFNEFYSYIDYNDLWHLFKL